MLKVLTLKQSEEWDAIVRSFDDHDVYWFSGYVKAFELNGDGKPMLFYYDDGSVRGINVVMKRDVADAASISGKIEKGKYYDFVTPYGYGGWLIDGGRPQALFTAYEEWCRAHGIVCEFVRFHSVLQNHRTAEPFYEVTGLGNTVCMDVSSEDGIWNMLERNRMLLERTNI